MARVYVSMMLRNLAIALTGIFVPIYMMQIGYSFIDICWLIIVYFGVRIVYSDLLVGKITAYLGPKRTMFIGYLATSISMLLFATQEIFWWPIWFLGCFWSMMHGMVAIPFNVEFSKIHNRSTEGSQLGYLHALEKIGHVIGPLAGGIIATIFGGQYIFAVGLVLLIVAGIPIIRTAESVKTRQKMNLSKLNFKKYRRNILTRALAGVEITMTSPMWQIFIAMTILTPGAVYLGISMLESISVAVAIIASIVIGHIVDKRHGRTLLRIGAVIISFFNVFRMFIGQYIPALLVNIGHEVGRAANSIPRQKGFFDEADSADETRIAYVVVAEYIDSAFKFVAWLVILAIAVYFGDLTALMAGFAIASVMGLATMGERYKALNK